MLCGVQYTRDGDQQEPAVRPIGMGVTLVPGPHRYVRAWPARSPAVGRRWAEQQHRRRASRGGDVPDTGVATDQQAAVADQCDQLEQAESACSTADSGRPANSATERTRSRS
jgi:hypothetical protein